MTALKQRAQALEFQYARQEELRFKTFARRDRMIGRWAGYVMGLDEVEAYASTLAAEQVVQPHRLLDRLKRDLALAGVTVTEADLGRRMDEFLDQASDELRRSA
ncbi:DUF1476 domain-containing protein [Rhizobium sp. S-51]|uniref:DUF1476 domain-containing protein n=1 Tax=Rhizobium terricola TaxID=2728849 RepID=A0A7Y0AWF2_9HYPH|nr:ATPase inhibitor subunit zeta [Rhizobium terricola]NML74724.1 DUF1476 domain-containing protein [Rhizobium terricola]